MAGVQNVEAAVGEDEFATGGMEPVAFGAHLGGREDLAVQSVHDEGLGARVQENTLSRALS